MTAIEETAIMITYFAYQKKRKLGACDLRQVTIMCYCNKYSLWPLYIGKNKTKLKIILENIEFQLATLLFVAKSEATTYLVR